MPKPSSRTLVVLSASLLSMVLGSVHAFSVFLEPLEQLFGASRSNVSMTYSLALVSLTIAVLVGHRVFSAIPSGLFAAVVCLVAAAGATLAAYANTMLGVWLGYGLVFGAANGFGYAFGLQISAQVNPGREGATMGIITASYALGAFVSPPLLSWVVSIGGFQWAMLGLAACLVLIAPICFSLFRKSGFQFQTGEKSTNSGPVSARSLVWLWLGYGAGVAAGLMAIGHATGIAKSAGLLQSLWIAPMMIAIFNMVGSFVGGWLADRVRHVLLLACLSIMSSLTLVFLALNDSAVATLLGLGIVGLTYGALIAAYPASISKMFGVLQGTRIYGRVFTAWGAAGLFAPWFAGFLFDLSGDYSVALGTAALLGFISAAAMFVLLKSKDQVRD